MKKAVKTLLLFTFLTIGMWTLVAYSKYRGSLTSNTQYPVFKPQELTIVYKPECKNCKKVLLPLFFLHALDGKSIHLLNANKLTKGQLDQLESVATPTFILENKVYNKVDFDRGNSLWEKSSTE